MMISVTVKQIFGALSGLWGDQAKSTLISRYGFLGFVYACEAWSQPLLFLHTLLKWRDLGEFLERR